MVFWRFCEQNKNIWETELFWEIFTEKNRVPIEPFSTASQLAGTKPGYFFNSPHRVVLEKWYSGGFVSKTKTYGKLNYFGKFSLKEIEFPLNFFQPLLS